MLKQNLALFLPPASALSTRLKAFFLSGCTLLYLFSPLYGLHYIAPRHSRGDFNPLACDTKKEGAAYSRPHFI